MNKDSKKCQDCIAYIICDVEDLQLNSPECRELSGRGKEFGDGIDKIFEKKNCFEGHKKPKT